MDSNQMIELITRIFPDAMVHDEGGQFTITTGIRISIPVDDLERVATNLAERLVRGDMQCDNTGQRVIYTGYVEEGF